jgi:hypothetical protein
MDVNPYQPPAFSDEALAELQVADSRRRLRPLGIWLLSGLHLVAGLFFSFGVFFLLRLREGGNPVLLRFWFLIPMMGIVAALGLGSGFGMWLGKRWGWWLATFYYTWGVLGVIADLGFALVANGTGGLAPILPRELTLFVIHGLILAYLLRRKVREFFRLEAMPMYVALAPLALLATLALVATHLLASAQEVGE